MLTILGLQRISLKYLQGQDLEIKEMELWTLMRRPLDWPVTAKLWIYESAAELELVQNQKSGGIVGEEAALDGISDKIIEQMEEDVIYNWLEPLPDLLEKLELPNTLLGIDIVKNKKLIAKDVNEKDILKYMKTMYRR